MVLYSWGFDGSSSGHSAYKQKFEASSSAEVSDENLFAITLISLLSGNNIILWNNRSSQFTKFWPIKLEFVKQSTNNS